MRIFREWLHRLGATIRPRRRDEDLAEEVRLHMELAAEAGRRVGGATQAMDALRDQRGLPWLDDLARDVRHAFRSLWSTPGFTAVALLTLALGIGANAAIFTLIDAILVKSLPVNDPGGLVLLGDASGRGVGTGQVGRSFVLYSHDLYTHLRDANALAGLCAVQSSDDPVGVRRPGWVAPQSAIARHVSGNYFQVLGVDAAVGRTIVPADDAPSARPVAVVSFRYWRDVLNEDPAAIGGALDLNGVPVTIVGVAPPAFYGETIQPDPPSFWLPMSVTRALAPEGNLIDEPDRHWLYLMGRLRPDDAAPQAQARLTLALQQWLRAREGSPVSAERQAGIANSRVELTAAGGGVPLMQRSYSQTLRLLLGVSMAVLLLACANIAGLLLARGMGQRSERSLRLALGATRGRLVRQSLAESLTLALAGGGLALLVAAAAAKLLVAMVFSGVDYVPIQTMPDARVLAFTFALSCGAAVLFGLLPAIRMRSDIAPSMKAARFRIGKAIVIGQVTVSLVVLAGAGALAYSLVNLTRQPFGFERTHVLVATVDPRPARYDYSRLAPLYEQLDARLNALPGVESASFSYYSPFNGCCWAFSVSIPGYAPRTDEDMVAVLNRVSPRYFATLGTKMLRGRAFGEYDTPASRRVIVVNDTFAQRFFQTENPLGRTIHIDSEGPDVDLEIVGVVEDAKYDEPREGMRPMVFMPFLQMKAGQPVASGDYRSNFISAIEVRATGDPVAIAERVRQTLAEIDPGLPVLRLETLSDQIGRTLGRERATATLAGFFGLLALVLTCIGLYGVMAYVVQRRTGEIGVRMALGATRGSVIAMLVREALAQAFTGIAVGIPSAFAATHLIANQLYGVSPTNAQTVAAATLVLIACLGVAGYLPARRASRIDPAMVLRAL
jgi:predicted permease